MLWQNWPAEREITWGKCYLHPPEVFSLPLVFVSRGTKMSVNPFWLARARALSPRVCHHDCWHHHPENERCSLAHIVRKQNICKCTCTRECVKLWAYGIIWWWMSTGAHRYNLTTFIRMVSFDDKFLYCSHLYFLNMSTCHHNYILHEEKKYCLLHNSVSTLNSASYKSSGFRYITPWGIDE